MNLGLAMAIWQHIDSDQHSILEKGAAIKKIHDMDTHNSVTKNSMLNVIGWMWDQIFIEREDTDEESG